MSTRAHFSSKALHTLTTACEQFTNNQVSLGLDTLKQPGPHASHLTGDRGVYHQMYEIKRKGTLFSRFQSNFDRTYGERCFKDESQSRCSTHLEKAQAISNHIKWFFENDPWMQSQGTVGHCPATPSCATFSDHKKLLVHVLAPNGEYVHAFAHVRQKDDEVDEISFREPKPSGFENSVLTAIPGFDYEAKGYQRIEAHIVDPSNPKEMASALKEAKLTEDLKEAKKVTVAKVATAAGSALLNAALSGASAAGSAFKTAASEAVSQAKKFKPS